MKQTQTIFITVFACAFIVGIFLGIRTAQRSNMDPSTSPITIYSCEDGQNIWVAYGENQAQISLPNGRFINLPQTVSASGMRYANSDESFVFLTKGKTSSLEENGEITFSNCVEK